MLEVRTENLKEGKSRQDMFAAQGAVVNSSMPQSAVSGFHSGSVLAMAEDDAQVGNNYEYTSTYRWGRWLGTWVGLTLIFG